MWKKIKYYLGFTTIVKTSSGWFVTKRGGFSSLRVYLDKDKDYWWFSDKYVIKYCTHSSKEEAIERLNKHKKEFDILKSLWQDI